MDNISTWHVVFGALGILIYLHLVVHVLMSALFRSREEHYIRLRKQGFLILDMGNSVTVEEEEDRHG